jgi:hypothetical protein
MWRQTLESQNERWNWFAEPPEIAPCNTIDRTEEIPSARILFLETGVVITAALATCFVIDTILTALGIPQPP